MRATFLIYQNVTEPPLSCASSTPLIDRYNNNHPFDAKSEITIDSDSHYEICPCADLQFVNGHLGLLYTSCLRLNVKLFINGQTCTKLNLSPEDNKFKPGDIIEISFEERPSAISIPRLTHSIVVITKIVK